ncbi:MAG TPA: thiamine phosphate synthase [Longimicrobiaceae bacterium]|nr:thiamine phosphate synthase [Longimicrobiaceae bacterium]
MLTPLVLVNKRADVALAAGADGVQLGGRSLDPADARRLLGAGKWVGASVHSAAEARAAAAAGAGFLLAGPVFATPSHPGSEGGGAALIEELVRCGRPVVAIGGVTPARLAALRSAGAAGIAAIRGIWEPRSTGAAVRRYLEAWQA